MDRIQKVQKLVGELGLQALVVDHVVNLYYLTGMELSLGRLVIQPDAATLFVDGRYFEGCRKKGTCEVLLTSGYDLKSPFGVWMHRLQQKRVGFDEQTTSYSEYSLLNTLGVDLVPVKNPVGRLREIKDPVEREALRQAAALGSSGMDYVINHLQEGITEKELARALEIFWLNAGGDKLGFTPIVAFGENSAEPHYRVSERKLKRGDLVLIDIGVVLKHYHSDMTRVVAFGEPHEELQKIYQIVYHASTEATRLCRPGSKIGDVDQAARGFIKDAGYGDYFIHSLGHGVGLEIHESPRINSSGPDANRVLESGMAITIEPGVYLPGIGGVRLEDTLLITEEGYENITCRPLSATLPVL